MTIDFECQKCESSFELDASDLIEGNEGLKCPNCDTKAPQALGDEFTTALNDICKSIANLRKKFTVSLALESDDLPAPYDVDEDEEEETAEEEDDLLDDVDEDEDEDDDYEEDEGETEDDDDF
ncbi:MAG: hypothetical protein ACK4N5_06795 [Myxococcales bacterium]